MSMEIRVKWIGSFNLKRRQLNVIKKKTYGRIGFYWWRYLMPIHFTPKGARRYGYAYRSTKDIYSGKIKTTKRGKAKAPSGNPLDWSGRSKALSRQKTIRSTSNRVRVTMPIRAFNFIPAARGKKFGSKERNYDINMRDEFTRVTAGEKREIESDASKDLTKRLQRFKGRGRVVFKG